MESIISRILCVDDEPNVLEGLQRQMRGQFELTCAVGPSAGLAALDQHGPFAVVLADYKMPEMSGIEFLGEARRRAPDTVAIMLTGCHEIDVAVRALHEGRIFRFLNKPCPRDIIVSALRDGVAQYQLIISQRQLTAALQDANAQLQNLNAQLESRVQERTAAIARLYDFVSNLNGMDSVSAVADLVVHTTAELLQSRRVSLMLPDPSGEYLTIAAAVGLDRDLADKVRVPVGADVSGQVFADTRPVVSDAADAARADGRYSNDVYAVMPLASAALLEAGRSVGVLSATEPWTDAPYDAEQLAMLQGIAESATVALLNQIRLEERNEARDAIILALAKLAENRDPETGAHLERVQSYCRLLSEVLAQSPAYTALVTPEFIATIYRSAPLHDIGKVGIPDRILLKPGKLSPAEFEIMQTHATIGGNTIRGLLNKRRRQEFLQMGMEIAYSHHEKYDGTGYPAGLRGEQIPLAARVMAVADVYDALRSRRVYKPAMGHDEALAIIRAGTGKHFDPAIVDAFLARADEFDRTAVELADKIEPHYDPTPDASASPAPATAA